MSRIVLLTGNHLCHNPRVIKEASTLATAGYQVEVLGAWSNADLKSKDKRLLEKAAFAFTPVVDFTTDSAARFAGRAKAKVSAIVHQSLHIESYWQLGPVLSALKKAARDADADLFIAHSEVGMAAAVDLLARGRKVGIDMEDWFSEDLLPAARKRRPLKLLHSLECRLLRDGVHRTCTSQALANALAVEYGCELPVTIYNAFAWGDRKDMDGLVKDRQSSKVVSIHWYSQTLGFGRGLDDLIAALHMLEYEAEIHLRGTPAAGFGEWLAKQLPEQWRKLVFVHDVVRNEELLSRIVEHDIGLATEQTYCRNKILTVSNKMMHYLLGGLAVVASDTAGQREVAEQAAGALLLYGAGDPVSLARQLNHLLSDSQRRAAARAAALKAAEEIFCWERQVPKLLRAVESALLGARG